ncbi:hypothetical protein ACE6H2_027700 [Prunus campanulata]
MAQASLSHFSSFLLILLLFALSLGQQTTAGQGLSIKEATIDDLQLAFKHNQLTSRQLVQFYLREISRLNPFLKGVIEVNPDALYLADKADYERKTKAPSVSLSKLHHSHSGQGLSIKEATIDDLQLAFKHNQLTSRQLVQFYLREISRLNPFLKGVIEVNPDALYLADKADYERKTKAPSVSLSKLHGIPILVKDNIATKDKLNTTAGSYALLGSVVPRDAGVVTKLRKAGAIILGKASLSEWSYWRSSDAPSGWSGRGGQGVNPYNFKATPSGSSSGSAISAAANLAAVTLGTETDGSILSPSSWNSVVGIKPTIGLTNRAGVVPISPRQDTVGPIARTVSDAAYVLDVIAGIDSNDLATIEASRYIPKGGYAQFLRPDGLRGKRIGIVRALFNFGGDASLTQTFEQHFNTLRKRGAVLVDNLEIAHFDEIYNASSESIALSAEFKIYLNTYLKNLVASPVRSLADVIAFNNKNSKLEKLKEYGQGRLLEAEATNGIGNAEKAALVNLAKLSKNGFEKLVTKERLDAVVAPSAAVSRLLAIAGSPGSFGSQTFSVHGLYIREATISDLQQAFKQNQLTSRKLVEFYLQEIRRLNPVLNAVIEVNPDALYQADKADYQRKAKGPVVPCDAGVVSKLRSVGAIILGKGSLSEWAQFSSLTAPAGWSARGGQGKNPYVLSATPCGSSSGPAISAAANLVAVSLGTETDVAILCPASFNSVASIKPTVGLTSRAGVIPCLDIAMAKACWYFVEGELEFGVLPVVGKLGVLSAAVRI